MIRWQRNSAICFSQRRCMVINSYVVSYFSLFLILLLVSSTLRPYSRDRKSKHTETICNTTELYNMVAQTFSVKGKRAAHTFIYNLNYTHGVVFNLNL